MSVTAAPGRKFPLTIFVAVLIGTTISVAALVSQHFLSVGAAAVLGIVVCGLATAILVSVRPSHSVKLKGHRRLIWVYVAIGALGVSLASLRGWTHDDSIGAAIWSLLFVGLLIAYRQRRRAQDSQTTTRQNPS